MGAETDDAKHGSRGCARGCAIAGVVLILVAFVFGIILHMAGRRWQRRVDDAVAAMRAAGEPVTWEEVVLSREPIPDDENAALVLDDAFPHLTSTYGQVLSTHLSFAGPRRNGAPHSAVSRHILRDHLSENAEALRLIHEAARLRRGAFRLDPHVSAPERDLSHLTQLRECSRLCSLEAVLRAEEDDMAGAVESLRAGAGLATSLGDCTTMIESLVRLSISAIWSEGLARVMELGELEPVHLGELRDLMAAHEAAFSIEPAFLGERSSGHDVFAVNARGSVDSMMRSELGPWWTIYDMVPTWRQRDALYYYGMMNRAIEVARTPVEQRAAAAQAFGDEIDQHRRRRPYSTIVSTLLMPGVSRFFQQDVTMHARLRVARAALAAEQWRMAHGRWPDSLDELVPDLLDAVPLDPFSGDHVIYRRTETGVMVYSIGQNAADDGGLSYEEAQGAAGGRSEDYDIVFRLLDPQLRRTAPTTFAQEADEAGLGAYSLEDAGYTWQRLRELGLSAADIRAIGEFSDAPPPAEANAGEPQQ